MSKALKFPEAGSDISTLAIALWKLHACETWHMLAHNTLLLNIWWLARNLFRRSHIPLQHWMVLSGSCTALKLLFQQAENPTSLKITTQTSASLFKCLCQNAHLLLVKPQVSQQLMLSLATRDVYQVLDDWQFVVTHTEEWDRNYCWVLMRNWI